jgi:Nucleotide modification associated domain 3
LKKQNVQKGDLFLFFGLFGYVNVNNIASVTSGKIAYLTVSPSIHVLFGWLLVEDVIDLQSTPGKFPHWLAYHPHVTHQSLFTKYNTVYIAQTSLGSLHPSLAALPGGGAFDKIKPGLVFPALTFEEALEIGEGIQKYAAGQRVRRLILFEKLNKEPDSYEARRLVTASGQYGLTKGGYQAEFLELTPEGNEATSDVVAPAKKLQARFNLAIQRHGPFAFLYEKLKGNRTGVLGGEGMTSLSSSSTSQRPECACPAIISLLTHQRRRASSSSRASN